MRTAIYIQDGVTQLVLTPESEWEKAVVGKIQGSEVTILKGIFYDCAGGWTRMGHGCEDESLILRVEVKTGAV